MDFEVGLGVLQDTVSFIFDAAPQKMTSDINSFIKITVEENKVFLYFYDTDLVIKTFCSVSSSALGSCYVDLGMLYRSISSLPNPEEKVSVKLNTQNVTIKVKSSAGGKQVTHKRVIPLFDAPSFIPSELENKGKISVNPSKLLNALKKVVVSLTPYVDKNVMSGVLLDCKEGELRVASMNVVSVTEIKSNLGSVGSFGCVVPGKVISKIIKVLSKTDDADVGLMFSKDGLSMTLNAGDSSISFPLSREEFRDYSKLLKDYKNCATIESSLFLENIRNLGFAFNKDDRFRVSLAFNNGELTLSAGESDNTGIEVLGFGDEFHIDFNAFLLEAIVKNIPSEHFNIHFKASNSPVMITNIDTSNESVISILAPLQ